MSPRSSARWQHAAQPLPVLPAPARVTGRRVLLVDAPGSAQTYFWLANVGVPRRYPERAALNMANMAFGGSLGSMLNQELRVKSGLTYDASSRFVRGAVAGEFAISSFTQTANTGARDRPRAGDSGQAQAGRTGQGGHRLGAQAICWASIRWPSRHPLTGPSLWATSISTACPRATSRSSVPICSRSTPPRIRTVIDTAFPSPENLDIVLIGDAAAIGDVAAKLGPVTKMSLVRARVFSAERAPS